MLMLASLFLDLHFTPSLTALRQLSVPLHSTHLKLELL